MKITYYDASILGFFLPHPCSVTERKAMTGKEFTRCILFGVKKHGVAVLADKLMSFIKTYGKQPVTFELIDNLLQVMTGSSRVKIEPYPVEEYPQPIY